MVDPKNWVSCNANNSAYQTAFGLLVLLQLPGLLGWARQRIAPVCPQVDVEEAQTAV